MEVIKEEEKVQSKEEYENMPEAMKALLQFQKKKGIKNDLFE